MKRIFLSIIVVILLSTAYSYPALAQPDLSGYVVRIYYADEQQLQEFAATNDIWEVNKDKNYFITALSAAQYTDLQKRGVRVEVDRVLTQRMWAPADLSCYRTVEQLYEDMRAAANEYPELVQILDVGDSWEKEQMTAQKGYDILAARVTNHAISSPKPAFFLVAAHHARELVTPELALNYLDYLTANYGSDAKITWLLNTREVWVMPVVNPDGHKLAEQGYYQRKNTNHTNGGNCMVPPLSYNQFGTDLNRNYEKSWGTAGTSVNPCNELYRGTAPWSEPETIAVRDFCRAYGIDFLITLHSYGNLVLWPWSHTYDPAPDSAALAAIGEKMATYNDYQATSGANLYLASGTTDDWSYDELGIPSYTFECGEHFFQPCADLPQIWQENLGAFLLATELTEENVLDRARIQGPEVHKLEIAPMIPTCGDIVTLTAQLTGENITAAQCFVNVEGTDGTGIPLYAVDGAFDGDTEEVWGIIDTAALSAGRHIVLVNGQDAAGNWGTYGAKFVEVEQIIYAPALSAWGAFAIVLLLSGTLSYYHLRKR